jgi:hypothetical protein
MFTPVLLLVLGAMQRARVCGAALTGATSGASLLVTRTRSQV